MVAAGRVYFDRVTRDWVAQTGRGGQLRTLRGRHSTAEDARVAVVAALPDGAVDIDVVPADWPHPLGERDVRRRRARLAEAHGFTAAEADALLDVPATGHRVGVTAHPLTPAEIDALAYLQRYRRGLGGGLREYAGGLTEQRLVTPDGYDLWSLTPLGEQVGAAVVELLASWRPPESYMLRRVPAVVVLAAESGRCAVRDVAPAVRAGSA